MSLRALFDAYLEAKHRSLQGLGMSGDPYEDAINFASEARDHHRSVVTLQNPSNKIAELDKAYEAYGRAEIAAMTAGSINLVKQIRKERNTVNQERSMFKKLIAIPKTSRVPKVPGIDEENTLTSEFFQTRFIDDMFRSLINMKSRFATAKNIATMKNARSYFRFETYKNILKSRSEEEERPLTREEKNAIWDMIPDPTEERLSKIRNEASIRMLTGLTNRIRTRIDYLSRTNPEAAARYTGKFETILRMGPRD
jgi:hypothetical protein